MLSLNKRIYTRRAKPPIGSFLDFNNPYTRLMNDCILFNENGGNNFANLFDPAGAGITYGPDVGWVDDYYYKGVQNYNTSSVFIGGGRSCHFANNSNPFTIRCIFKFNSFPSTNNALFARFNASSKSIANRLEFSLMFNSSGNISYYNIGSTTSRAGDNTWSIGLQAGVVYDLVWVVNGTTIVLYVDGVLACPSGTSVWRTAAGNSLGAYDSTATVQPISLGGSDDGSTLINNSANTYYLFQSWIGRALTQNEVLELYNEPFNVIAPGRSIPALQNSIAEIIFYSRRSYYKSRSGTRTMFC